jgi:hypothetical protein
VDAYLFCLEQDLPVVAVSLSVHPELWALLLLVPSMSVLAPLFLETLVHYLWHRAILLEAWLDLLHSRLANLSMVKVPAFCSAKMLLSLVAKLLSAAEALVLILLKVREGAAILVSLPVTVLILLARLPC